MIPRPQMGGLAGLMFHIFLASLAVVFAFTTGTGPVIVWAVMFGAVVIVAYFALARLIFRLKRGAL